MISSIDYKDPKIMGQIMKKVTALCLRYYVDADCVVMTNWGGKWYPWHEVMLRDNRMKV